MFEIYIDSMKAKGKYLKWSRKKIKKMLEDEIGMKVDVFMTAEQTVEWGWADEIFDGDWKALK